MSDSKKDGPVLDDENFVNVDPDFANWANEVDRPLPISEERQVDFNLPPEYKEKEEDKKDEKEDEKKVATPKASTATPTLTPASK